MTKKREETNHNGNQIVDVGFGGAICVERVDDGGDVDLQAEINVRLVLGPHVSHRRESLQIDDQDGRRTPDAHRLGGDLFARAKDAIPLDDGGSGKQMEALFKCRTTLHRPRMIAHGRIGHKLFLLSLLWFLRSAWTQ